MEEIYFPEDPVPLYINKNSESLKVIQHLRDEAHRFGISFHRNKFTKALLATELLKIKGVGDKTIQKLLIEFKSVNNVKNADFESLIKIVGEAKAQILIDYFKKSKI